MLDRKYRRVRVDQKLVMGKGAKLIATSSAGVETTLDMTELAALNDIAAADLAKIDGITNGTVAAGKAVVVDSNKDASSFRNVTVTNLDAGASGTAGTVDIFPATASKGKVAISCTDQTGDTTVSLVVGAMGAARTITLRDPGAAASILTTTDSTAAATAATAVEITRACDVSARLVAGGSSLSVTEASHDGKTILLDTASGTTITLPAATGSGAKFRFVVSVKATSNQHRINVTGDDAFYGSYNILDMDAAAQAAYAAGADADQFNMNGTTTGGLVGDWVEVQDIAADKWQIMGQLCCPAGSNPATSFATGQVS